MIVIVCGGRDYEDADHVHKVLSRLRVKLGITHIVHGGAQGADWLAHNWGLRNGVQPVSCPAMWEALGRKAGALHNRSMLALGVQRVIYFPGGKGTADMVKAAKTAGIRCIRG